MKYLSVKLNYNNVIAWEYAGPFDSYEQAEEFCDSHNKGSGYPRWIVQRFTQEE